LVYVVILPQDYISEKTTACIRRVRITAQRSHLLPELKESVLQLWK